LYQQQIFGGNLPKSLVAMVALLSLSGCSLLPFGAKPEPEVKVVTKIEKTTVPIVARPKPVNLVDTRIYVVNKDNYDEFVKEFTDANGELVYIALSVKDYENLALNIAELRRYLNQQTEIIVYYETAVSPEKINNTEQEQQQ
jgi:hypothetical protein